MAFLHIAAYNGWHCPKIQWISGGEPLYGAPAKICGIDIDMKDNPGLGSLLSGAGITFIVDRVFLLYK